MVTRYFLHLTTVTKAIHCLSCKLQKLFMFCSSFFKLLIWDFPHVTLMYNLYFLKMLLTNQTNFFCFQFDLHEKLQKLFHSITFLSHTSINKSLQKSWIYLLHSQNLESLDEVGISWWQVKVNPLSWIYILSYTWQYFLILICFIFQPKNISVQEQKSKTVP